MSPIKRTYSAQEIKHNQEVYNLVSLQFLTKTLLKINEMKYNGGSAHFLNVGLLHWKYKVLYPKRLSSW
jgi:hypothetical protein